eukprot:jgi/Psemu1/59513/gm1.59513_g
MATSLTTHTAKSHGITNRTNTTPNQKINPKDLWGFTPYRPQLACGGSIWDDDLNKWAAYRDLIKHPKAAIQELWLKSGEDEFDWLFQGFQPNNIEGMDADPYRTRITAGGDQLEYHREVSTRTASMETIKTHWNSVVSTPGAKYCKGDISNCTYAPHLMNPNS